MMHESVRRQFVTAIEDVVRNLQVDERFTDPRVFWLKREGGQPLKTLDAAVRVAHPPHLTYASQASMISQAIVEHHPEHAQPVGLATGEMAWFGLERWTLVLLRRVADELWRRRLAHTSEELDAAPKEIDSAQIWGIVDEISEFIDRDAVSFTCVAPLVNFRMEASELELPHGVMLRQLTEREINETVGGPVWELLQEPVPHAPRAPTYALTASYEEPKYFGEDSFPDEFRVSPGYVTIRERFERTVTALTVLGSGTVGYRGIYRIPSVFCPAVITTVDEWSSVPPGNYELGTAEGLDLCELSMSLEGIPDTLRRACSRLRDAECRTEPGERVLDAVVGLELLMLHEISDKSNVGELKYRLSVHFASLYEGADERLLRYQQARHAYDLRSRVAHGGALPESVKFGDEKIGLELAAERVVEMLRFAIRFLLRGNEHRTWNSEANYWQRRLFADGSVPN